MRATLSFVIAGLAAGTIAAAQDVDVRAHTHEAPGPGARHVATAYQGGAEQTERFSRKVKIGRDGSVSISNVSGEITVTGGSGDEVSIEAVKRTHGGRASLSDVTIDVDERGGRVDVRTNYPHMSNVNISVDYTVTVPSSASVEVHSVSGGLKITGVTGSVRAESVSGNVTTAKTPHLELAKSVSGSIDLTDATTDADLTASSVSGEIKARGLKARTLQVGTVSGDVVLGDVACERLTAKTVSGGIEYSGTLAANGRYEMNSHSGNLRLTLSSNVGFELNASTFSGSIRSDLPLTIGGGADRSEVRSRGMSNRSIRATYGDGSAVLTLRTFSGDVIIAKK